MVAKAIVVRKSFKCGFESHPGHLLFFFLCSCMSTFGETVISEDFKRDVICSFDPITTLSKNNYRFYAFTVYSPKESQRIFVSLDNFKKHNEELSLSKQELDKFYIIVNDPQYIGGKLFFSNAMSKIFYFYWYVGDLSKLNEEIDIQDIQLNLRNEE